MDIPKGITTNRKTGIKDRVQLENDSMINKRAHKSTIGRAKRLKVYVLYASVSKTTNNTPEKLYLSSLVYSLQSSS